MSGEQISVSIGGSRVPRVLRYEQVAAFGKHTVATLDVPLERRQRPMAPEWTPVVATLAASGKQVLWYGYVHHGAGVSSLQDSTGSSVRYTFIGTSLPMNSEQTRSWKEVSASSLARQIGHEHRLRTMVSPSIRRLPYYAQTGSDWAVLKDLATQSGSRLWVDGPTLLFVDPAVLLQGAQARDIPVFSHNRMPGRVDTIFEWYAKVGTMVPRESGRALPQTVTGLDLRTGRLVVAKQAATSIRTTYQNGMLVPQAGAHSQVAIGPDGIPILNKVSTGSRVASMGEASDLASAEAKNAQGWVTASARVAFSPGLQPGRVVKVEGAAIPSSQTGYWLVTGVSHRLLQDSSNPVMNYSTQLELERNTKDSPTFSSRYNAIGTSDTVYARLRNGLFWEADYMEDVSVG